MPFPPAHGAMSFRSLRIYPFHDALKMERMVASTSNCKFGYGRNEENILWLKPDGHSERKQVKEKLWFFIYIFDTQQTSYPK
ncbi:hypothetical protein WN944_005491 [Citrus x changshan-huyou]|uniref:Uncharacterized protein n=1 Tax=Citrus x changshan-huyou TaxID=2935761 RepID=A0AAP0M8L1_9ROSI